jgi:hypothetical protein
MAGSLYHVTDSGTGLTATVGAYDPGITSEVNAKIRNLPIVKKYCNDMANLTRGRAGEGFIVVEAGGKARYRAYVAPDTSEAIKAELKDGVLLKAALSMRGK